jgi:hypothetical protein
LSPRSGKEEFMHISRGQLAWGITLILLGAFIFVQQQGLITVPVPFFALLFGATGLLFFMLALTNWSLWGFLYPGLSLIAIALVIFLATNALASANIIGVVFLGCIALAFWLTLLMRPSNWWALIPGGAITVLAIMPLLAETGARAEVVGAVFFLGLAATFALVRLWTIRDQRMSWAWYPALILGLFGLLVLGAGDPNTWPLVLIAIGLLFLIRALLPRRPPPLEVEHLELVEPAEPTETIGLDAKG